MEFFPLSQKITHEDSRWVTETIGASIIVLKAVFTSWSPRQRRASYSLDPTPRYGLTICWHPYSSLAFMGPTVLFCLSTHFGLRFKPLKLVHPGWEIGSQGHNNLRSEPPKALCSILWSVCDGRGELSASWKVVEHLRETTVLFHVLTALSLMFRLLTTKLVYEWKETICVFVERLVTHRPFIWICFWKCQNFIIEAGHVFDSLYLLHISFSQSFSFWDCLIPLKQTH